MWHDVDGSFAKAAKYARQAPCQAVGSAPGTSTASIPVSSVCPDAISASPHDAFLPAMTCVSDPCDHFTKQAPNAAPDRILSALYSRPSRKEPEPVPTGPRLNPRRTAGGHHRLTGPPILTRQSDRRINFVDNLVDSSTQVVEAIWPCSSVGSHYEPSYNTGLPLRTFIQETLRRSRTSYSTLQLALYYLILLKPHVPRHLLASEQPNDRSSDHPLQCGRRMFLTALILASKYLQDRNYSARAWSRMSGLNTQEINSNEIAFLMAINWKLHVVEEVFQRWNDIVLRFTSPGPSSPGGAMLTHASQLTDWKQVILGLDPELTRIEPLLSSCRTNPGKTSDLSVLSPRSILNSPQECATRANAALNPAPTSAFIEPTLTTSLGTSLLLPTTSALVSTSMAGSLPTPRPTPQSSWLSTPEVSAAPQSSARSSAMSVAMTQAHCCLGTSQNLDRLHQSLTSPPQGYYCAARRSSLANSVSTASSPESMISDSSRSSHCSSASVTSSSCPSYYNGPGRCSLPTRSRVSRLWSDRLSARSMVPSLAEDHERCLSSPPAEVYVGPTVKSGGANAETRLALRELEDQARDAASDAARVLQDLHKHGYPANVTVTTKTGLKRNRAGSAGDSGLRDNMHNMLAGRCDSVERQWTEARVQAAAGGTAMDRGPRASCGPRPLGRVGQASLLLRRGGFSARRVRSSGTGLVGWYFELSLAHGSCRSEVSIQTDSPNAFHTYCFYHSGKVAGHEAPTQTLLG